MSEKSESIAALLHQTRSSSWTVDDTLSLSAAIKGATADEAAMALISFTLGMLASAHSATLLQRETALLEEGLAVRNGLGLLQ